MVNKNNLIAKLALPSKTTTKRTISGQVNLSLNLGKPTKLSHFVFREIPFLDIEAAVALLCRIIGAQDLLYK